MAYVNNEETTIIAVKGDNGDSAYIRYSAYSDGTDFTETWTAGQNYVGFATGKTAPTDKSGYTWLSILWGNVVRLI